MKTFIGLGAALLLAAGSASAHERRITHIDLGYYGPGYSIGYYDGDDYRDHRREHRRDRHRGHRHGRGHNRHTHYCPPPRAEHRDCHRTRSGRLVCEW